MDGFEGTEGVILLAATNRVDVLDPALLRPGRFDRRIHVNKPDVRGRQAILEVHTRKTPLAGDVDLSLIARGTPGFAGADLENLVNEAALHAARRDQDSVHNEDFESAKDKVMMGSARRSMSISEKEKKHTAYHEAGHAIVGRLIEGNDPVHKVTIIPRGQALGLTMTLPEEDSYTMTKAKCEAMISFLMGGRIAEEITFGHLTSGASNDIERATQIARKMVTEWGMSEKLGPLNFGHHNDHVFLGREMGSAPDYGVETGRLIDSEIQQLVKQNYDRARKVLEENKDILEAMSLALIERETIDMADIKLLMERKALPEFVPTIQPKSYSDSRDEEEKKESEKGSSDIAGKAIDPSDPVKA